jgi:hypothetical protein
MTEDTAVRGMIEGFSNERIGGWVQVSLGGNPVAFTLELRFKGLAIEYAKPMRARMDLGGAEAGFEFQVPDHIAKRSLKEFVELYEGVFVKWATPKGIESAPLNLFKTALTSFLESGTARANAPAQPQRRVALLVRTHLKNAKAAALGRQLEDITGADLFMCVDETAGPVKIGQYRHLSHSVEKLMQLGLWTASLPRALYFFGDFPFYAAIGDAPNYDFYLMIEYDVALGVNGAAWFQQLVDRIKDLSQPLPDFFSPGMGVRYEKWYWHAHAMRLLGGSEIWATTFPIVGLSKAAIANLFSHRLSESENARRGDRASLIAEESNGLPYCEYFVPTRLHRDGRFLLTDPQSLGLRWDSSVYGDYSVHRPLLHGSLQQGESVIQHPVLEWDEYRRKLKHFLGSSNDSKDWLRVSRLVDALPIALQDDPTVRQARGHPLFSQQGMPT